VVLYENGKFYFYTDAIIRIAKILGGFSRLSVLFRIIPEPIRDRFYNYIAKHRYTWFGKRDSCMIQDSRFSERFFP
jgi:predicted DCC family thiol-disulfide oxidoreductase YuxK